MAATASVLVPLYVVLLALRWLVFLRQQSIPTPWATVWAVTWAGQFFNSVLPGTTGGDIFKIYQACRLAPDRKPAAAASVIIDRLVALAALVVLALLGWWNGVPRELGELYSFPYVPPWLLAGLSVALALAVFVGWRSLRRGRPREIVGRLLTPLREALRPSRYLAAGFGLALAVHLLTFLSFYLFARALGIGISYTQVLMIVPVILLMVLLPVTVNGHGLREVLLVYYFARLHLSAAAAPSAGTTDTVVALSALLVANDLLWSIAGGLCYLIVARQNEVPAGSTT